MTDADKSTDTQKKTYKDFFGGRGVFWLGEDLQSHDGLLGENAEKAHNLHHNLHSPEGLLDENAEEAHNLQCKMGS